MPCKLVLTHKTADFCAKPSSVLKHVSTHIRQNNQHARYMCHALLRVATARLSNMYHNICDLAYMYKGDGDVCMYTNGHVHVSDCSCANVYLVCRKPQSLVLVCNTAVKLERFGIKAGDYC